MRVVAVQGAAEITGMTEAMVRHAVQDGRMLPEAVVAGHALWRASTLERWARSERRTFPISPRLEVVGLGDLAVRFGVTPAAIRKWRYEGSLPAPDHTPSGLLLWDESTVRKMLPACGGGHVLDVVEVEAKQGSRTRVRCACGEWTTVRPPGKPRKRSATV